jgi:hypothetical protein
MMAHQESTTGTALRTPGAAAAAGIVFSLLFSLALVLLLVSAPPDTATEGVWLTDPSHRATLAVALNLVPFGMRTGLRSPRGADDTAIDTPA